MKTTIDVDIVLDLLKAHQDDLAERIDGENAMLRSHTVLWEEYKAISKLYDDVRRASNESRQQAEGTPQDS